MGQDEHIQTTVPLCGRWGIDLSPLSSICLFVQKYLRDVSRVATGSLRPPTTLMTDADHRQCH